MRSSRAPSVCVRSRRFHSRHTPVAPRSAAGALRHSSARKQRAGVVSFRWIGGAFDDPLSDQAKYRLDRIDAVAGSRVLLLYMEPYRRLRYHGQAAQYLIVWADLHTIDGVWLGRRIAQPPLPPQARLFRRAIVRDALHRSDLWQRPRPVLLVVQTHPPGAAKRQLERIAACSAATSEAQRPAISWRPPRSATCKHLTRSGCALLARGMMPLRGAAPDASNGCWNISAQCSSRLSLEYRFEPRTQPVVFQHSRSARLRTGSKLAGADPSIHPAFRCQRETFSSIL